jgi:hypothetical protein
MQYGLVSQRLKSPLVMQSPPTRTNLRQEISLTEPYWYTMYRWIYIISLGLWCCGCLVKIPVLAQVQPSTPTPSVSPQEPKTVTVKTGEVLRIKVDALKLNQPIAVFLGDTDITAKIKIEGQELVYQSNLLPLPIGQQPLTIYLTKSADNWETLATFLIKVEPAVAQSPTAPDKDSNSPSSPPEKAKSPENIFTLKPKFTANLKSQLFEKRSADAGASQRPSAIDLSFTGGLSSQYKSGTTTIDGSFNVIGSTFQPDSLRFNQLQGRASQFDLSEYIVDLTDTGNKFSIGHVCVGNHPLLFNNLCTRGLAGKVQLNDFADISVGRISTTKIVGFENILGLERSANTLTGASLGLQVMNNAADGVRLETTLFGGSRLPEAGFEVGEVVDAEESNGIGWRLIGTNDTGRWKADAGFARSTFVNIAANDPQLTGGLNIAPLQPVTKNAWYAETNYELLKDLPLDGKRKLSLNANLRVEQADPQFGTIGATVNADRLQTQYGLNATIAGATVQLQQTNFEDNIVNIPNLLKTNNRSTIVGLTFPLQSFLEIKNSLLPTVSYNYQQTSQLGSIAAAQNGGFNLPSQIPDLSSAIHKLGLSWDTPGVVFNYKFSSAVDDNRQLGRENADFRRLNHQVSVDLKPSPQLRFNLGYNFTNSLNVEQNLTRFTNSPTLGASWEFQPDTTLAFNYNRNNDTDSRGQSSTDENGLELLLTWNFRSNFLVGGASQDENRENPGSVFLRYGRQSVQNRSGIINTDRTVDIINAGVSWSF